MCGELLKSELKKVSMFILMNEMLLLIPFPFMRSVDCNGKLTGTSPPV